MLSNLSKDIIYVHGICRFIVKHNAIYKKRTKTDLLSGKLFFNLFFVTAKKKDGRMPPEDNPTTEKVRQFFPDTWLWELQIIG